MSELRDYLPPKLREIADVIGEPAALKLSDAWPGVRLFVPQAIGPDHPVALAIGITASGKLAKHYGGDTITMPKAEAWRRQLRDAKIIEEYAARASGRDLALKYGLHENYIYQLVAKHDAKRQPDLFCNDQ